MPGPAPESKEILALRGSWRADKGDDAPAIPVGVPDCPEWVNGPAKEWWPEIAGQLAKMRIMGAPYTCALALLVDALGDYLDAKAVLEAEGNVYESDSGVIRPRPELAMKTNAWERVLKASKEFGLTPASKTRARAEAKELEGVESRARQFFQGRKNA